MHIFLHYRYILPGVFTGDLAASLEVLEAVSGLMFNTPPEYIAFGGREVG